MAEFCVLTRMSPAEYKQLTLVQYLAFLDVINRMNEVEK